MTDNVSTAEQDFLDTLKPLAVAAKAADKAESAVKEKATAHAPHAISAMFGYGEYKLSIDGWIAAACDNCGESGIRSKKGKRNAAALRENGFTGLYNMAVALKYIDDNTEKYPGIGAILDLFMRHEENKDCQRLFLVRNKIVSPIQGETMPVEDVIAAYETADGDKEKHETAYWDMMDRPATFAALVTRIKDHVRDMKAADADATGEKMAAFVKMLEDMEVAELRKYQEQIDKVMAALEASAERIAKDEDKDEGRAESDARLEREAA